MKSAYHIDIIGVLTDAKVVIFPNPRPPRAHLYRRLERE
jgi:hypothetical protein